VRHVSWGRLEVGLQFVLAFLQRLSATASSLQQRRGRVEERTVAD
jgi:hypothetical protein